MEGWSDMFCQASPASERRTPALGVKKTPTAEALSGTDVATGTLFWVHQHTEGGGPVAEIGIEEKKRGAPWVLILVLLLVAVVIGWWLWSNRSSGEPTINSPAGTVADSAAATPATTQ